MQMHSNPLVNQGSTFGIGPLVDQPKLRIGALKRHRVTTPATHEPCTGEQLKRVRSILVNAQPLETHSLPSGRDRQISLDARPPVRKSSSRHVTFRDPVVSTVWKPAARQVRFSDPVVTPELSPSKDGTQSLGTAGRGRSVQGLDLLDRIGQAAKPAWELLLTAVSPEHRRKSELKRNVERRFSPSFIKPPPDLPEDLVLQHRIGENKGNKNGFISLQKGEFMLDPRTLLAPLAAEQALLRKKEAQDGLHPPKEKKKQLALPSTEKASKKRKRAGHRKTSPDLIPKGFRATRDLDPAI